MRTEITEHALVIQLRCRSAGVDFLWMEWMHMYMCGPEKEMPFTSLKVYYSIFVLCKYIQVLDLVLKKCLFCVQVLSFGGMTVRMTRYSHGIQKVIAIQG